MAIGSQSLSHDFNISEIAFRGVPVATSVFNELDYHGSLLGFQRLPEERNADYKKRLLDVYVHRANSTYTGLINGITRELGLDFFNPIRITLATGVNPTWSPRIEFIDSTVYVWKDSFTKELDLTIDRSDPTKPTYFIGGLVDALNTSTVFDAVLLDPSLAYRRSDCILNQSSSKSVAGQALRPSIVNHLGNHYIDRGSVFFVKKDIFNTEVNSSVLVNSLGKYYIDYQMGQITSFQIPGDSAIIQYSFREEIFEPTASPVIVRALHSPEFQKVLFHQNEQQDGTLTHGTPTDTGASIINELLSVVPMYWGR